MTLTKSDKIRLALERDPELSSAIVAKAVGCSKRLVRLVREDLYEDTKKPVKILIFDIETAPMEVYVWGLYKQRIPINNVIKDWSLLSWSAKWLCDSEIMGMHVTPKEAIRRQDESIILQLWNLFEIP